MFWQGVIDGWYADKKLCITSSAEMWARIGSRRKAKSRSFKLQHTNFVISLDITHHWQAIYDCHDHSSWKAKIWEISLICSHFMMTPGSMDCGRKSDQKIEKESNQLITCGVCPSFKELKWFWTRAEQQRDSHKQTKWDNHSWNIQIWY